MKKFLACENSNSGSNQLTLIHLIYFQVPDPAAFFPLNSAYGTREFQDRTPEGLQGAVFLAPGPNGVDDGSYEFSGTSNSYIEFPNSAGAALDLRYSITFLCWVYYNGQDGPLFVYDTRQQYLYGLTMYAFGGAFVVVFEERNYQSQHALYSGGSLAGGWKFVGVSYDNISGEAKLWNDGVMETTDNIGPGFEQGTYHTVRMGVRNYDGRYFRGRISQVRIYNVALTQEEILEIKGKNVIHKYETTFFSSTKNARSRCTNF